MIQTRVIPVATATEQALLVEVTENVCKPYCVNSSNQPTGTIQFSAGAVQVVNNYALVPIVAKVAIVSPSNSECGCAHTQVITERFDVAFVATTENTITLASGAEVSVTPAYVKCCKARGAKLITTLTITIS